jgi:hypothetical protein
MARAHYLAMDFSEAVSEARQALHASPNYRAIHITLIAALGQLGLIDEAHAAMADALERSSALSSSLLRGQLSLQNDPREPTTSVVGRLIPDFSAPNAKTLACRGLTGQIDRQP